MATKKFILKYKNMLSTFFHVCIILFHNSLAFCKAYYKYSIAIKQTLKAASSRTLSGI